MSNQITSQEEQQMNLSEKHSNIFNEFFWICSGANRRILRQCPTEYSKYFGIGGTIFFTAAMAALSGGYAISMVFDDNAHSVLIGILFGLFWGLLIFNLDRFMVNTMYTDGTHHITKEEFKCGAPRLILAIFIGLVISTPIELRIFKDKIDEQLIEDRKNLAEIQYRPRITNLEQEIGKLETYRANLVSQNDEYQSKIDQAWNSYDEERTGRGGSGKIGYGPNAQRRETFYNQTRRTNEPRIDKNNQKIDDLDNQIAAKKSEKDKINTLIAQLIDNSNTTKGIGLEGDVACRVKAEGFADRLKAFNAITMDFKNNGGILLVARILVIFLFIALEIIPTLFKMMIASGPYDELLREEMERKKTRAITDVSKLHDDANTQIQISVAKNEERLKAELAANKEVLSKIAAVQAELLETAIEEWRKAELEKIKSNPSQYIKSNTTNA